MTQCKKKQQHLTDYVHFQYLIKAFETKSLFIVNIKILNTLKNRVSGLKFGYYTRKYRVSGIGYRVWVLGFHTRTRTRNPVIFGYICMRTTKMGLRIPTFFLKFFNIIFKLFKKINLFLSKLFQLWLQPLIIIPLQLLYNSYNYYNLVFNDSHNNIFF